MPCRCVKADTEGLEREWHSQTARNWHSEQLFLLPEQKKLWQKYSKLLPKRIKRSNGLVLTSDMSVIVTTQQGDFTFEVLG